MVKSPPATSVPQIPDATTPSLESTNIITFLGIFSGNILCIYIDSFLLCDYKYSIKCIVFPNLLFFVQQYILETVPDLRILFLLMSTLYGFAIIIYLASLVLTYYLYN